MWGRWDGLPALRFLYGPWRPSVNNKESGAPTVRIQQKLAENRKGRSPPVFLLCLLLFAANASLRSLAVCSTSIAQLPPGWRVEDHGFAIGCGHGHFQSLGYLGGGRARSTRPTAEGAREAGQPGKFPAPHLSQLGLLRRGEHGGDHAILGLLLNGAPSIQAR